MSQIYIGYDFKVNPLQPGTEILIAELGYVGFESFVETEKGVTAYIQKEEWKPNILEEMPFQKLNKSTGILSGKKTLTLLKLTENVPSARHFTPLKILNTK